MDCTMRLGMLDWDDTRIVFTKRELLNFLKLVLSIDCDGSSLAMIQSYERTLAKR